MGSRYNGIYPPKYKGKERIPLIKKSLLLPKSNITGIKGQRNKKTGTQDNKRYFMHFWKQEKQRKGKKTEKPPTKDQRLERDQTSGRNTRN